MRKRMGRSSLSAVCAMASSDGLSARLADGGHTKGTPPTTTTPHPFRNRPFRETASRPRTSVSRSRFDGRRILNPMSGSTEQMVATTKQRFLDAYAQLGTVTSASEHVGISRRDHYHWMERDPDYPARFQTACEKAVDKLEREVVRRGAEGWDEPVYQGGKLVGTVRKHSDLLLIFALKGLRPDKYREKHSVEHTVVTVGAIEARIAELEAEIAERARQQADR